MSLKKVYCPQDFGKSPLLLGFRRSLKLKQYGKTVISIDDILDTSKKYVEGFGVPTHWRANMGSLKLYSEKDSPLNTRIDRKSMKEIPIDLLQGINQEAEAIIVKRGLFQKKEVIKKPHYVVKNIERPSYYFDYEICGTADVYWFT